MYKNDRNVLIFFKNIRCKRKKKRQCITVLNVVQTFFFNECYVPVKKAFFKIQS